MRIEKISGGRSTLSQRRLPELAASVVTEMAGDIARWRPMLYSKLPANTITAPTYPKDKQGLPNQAMALGNFKLADNEALIIKVTLGGARYFTIPVYNVWDLTGDYRQHTSSFNNRQTAPNPDGSLTYVLSARDPGVHNLPLHPLIAQRLHPPPFQALNNGNSPAPVSCRRKDTGPQRGITDHRHKA